MIEKSKINARTWVKIFFKNWQWLFYQVFCLVGWECITPASLTLSELMTEGRKRRAISVVLGWYCMPPTERLTTWHLCFEPRPCTSARLPRRAWYCDTKPCHLYAATARLLAYARTAGSHVSRRCGGAQRLYCKPQMHMDISFAYKGAE